MEASMATSWDKRTHQPVNLADWRIQRCKDDAKKLPTEPTVRSPMVGDAAPPPHHPSPPQSNAAALSASSARHAGATDLSLSGRYAEPISAAHPYEPWQDNLRAARGIAFACL